MWSPGFLSDSDSDSRADSSPNKTWSLTPNLGLIVWHTDCVLKDDWREILNSYNKRCTTVYKQSFNRKINCTKVKQTTTKLHANIEETDRAQSLSLLQTDRAQSLSLLQKRHSDSGPKPGLRGTRTPGDSTPLINGIFKRYFLGLLGLTGNLLKV